MKFKKGDIITGNKKSSHYLVTTKDAVMEVMSVCDDHYIDVKLLDHKYDYSCNQHCFKVQADCFKLYKRKFNEALELDLLNRHLLGYLLASAVPRRLRSLKYTIEWEEEAVHIGCQTINKSDVLAFARAALRIYGGVS